MGPHREIVGVILAGGRSRRLGGGDKGLADLAGEPVLGHVARRFATQVARLILNANGDAQRFAGLGLIVMPDGEYAELGPLSGMLAACRWIAANAPRAEMFATTTADAPFIPEDLVARLAQAGAGRAAIAVSGGRRHPTIGLWPRSMETSLTQALSAGRFGVDRFASAIDAIEVPFARSRIGAQSVDPFFNINTPDDLAAARAVLAGQQ